MRDQVAMTPDEREMEQRLRSLRPAPARIDAAGAAREVARRAARRRHRWQTAAAGTIVIACGAWSLVGRKAPPRTLDVRGAASTPAVAVVAAGGDDRTPPPTELVYRRAFMRSSAEFDALLGRHAMTGGTTDVDVTPAGAGMFWDVFHHLSSGDM